MSARLDLPPTPGTWSWLADQIGVDIFIAIRWRSIVIYVAFDLVIEYSVLVPGMASVELELAKVLRVWILWPRFWWLSRFTKASLILSNDLQSYRCPPDAAGSLHCLSHVIPWRCNIHFWALSEKPLGKVGTVSIALGLNVIYLCFIQNRSRFSLLCIFDYASFRECRFKRQVVILVQIRSDILKALDKKKKEGLI